MHKVLKSCVILLGLTVATTVCGAHAAEDGASSGFHNLVFSGDSSVTLPMFADPSVFSRLWTVWDNADERNRVASLAPQERLNDIFDHYGLIANPFSPELPIGFVVKNGSIAFNCVLCHTGQVQGKIVWGLPNRNLDLKTLYRDFGRLYPLVQGPFDYVEKTFAQERGLTSPVGDQNIATAFRDENMDLSLIPNGLSPMTLSLANAQPWWNAKFKTYALSDAVIPLNPRLFATVASDFWATGEDFRAQEKNLDDIFAYIHSLTPPAFPGIIDKNLAEQGKNVFQTSCSQCHGTYNSDGSIDYPDKLIPISVVQTDPQRAFPHDYETAINFYQNSWMGAGMKLPYRKPTGYLAPPLRGIWATAPYFHNGSVPTLWDVLHPNNRPAIWRMSERSADYDLEKVGLAVTVVNEIPASARSDASELSRYYDTRQVARGNYGHTFPNRLTEAEKTAVLEYLKTL